MNAEDGNSSEGIVCSTDDEFDGLSEAVEYHIMRHENTTGAQGRNFYNTNQFTNRKYEDFMQERSPFYVRQHINEVPAQFRTDRYSIRQQYHGPPVPGRYMHVGTNGGDYRQNITAEQPSFSSHVPRYSPPKRTILTPRQDVMRRHLTRNNQSAHEMRHIGPSPMSLTQCHQYVPSPSYIGNNPGHIPPGPSIYPETLPPHIGVRSHSSERYPPMMHIGNVPNPPRTSENYNISMDAGDVRTRSMEAFHPGPHFDKIKIPPKQVLLEIKSKPPPNLEYGHPLDPFSPPSVHGVTQDMGVRRWSHDKYEERHHENVKHKKELENIQGSLRIVKRDEKGRRKRRTRNSAESSSPVMKMKNDGEQVHRKRRRTRNSQRIKSNSETGSRKGFEYDRKVTLVREEDDGADVVYEEVEILEQDEKVSHSNPGTFASDSEDDEELLALRLNALTSALPPNAEASENVEDYEDDEELRLRLNALSSSLDAKTRVGKQKDISQRTEFERKKPKHLLRRVVETPKRVSRRRKSMRKSNVADQFLKQYSAISDSPLKKSTKKKPSDKPARKVAINYNAPQLTLFGEIVKNHQTTTKSDALRYIRHHPDDAAKTDIFLNLMKHDELNVTEVVDLHKRNLNQNKSNPELNSERKLERTTSQANVQEMESDKTNYDEIEMDLDDGDSDSGLVPPGTDHCLIKPPSLEPSEVSELAPIEEDSNKAVSDIEKRSLSNVPLTMPSQESIWSMLEHSTVLKPADQDLDSTVTDVEIKSPTDKIGTPTQESMWGMLEHRSILTEEAVSDPPEKTKKRAEISLENAEIDDASLVRLREVLLQQLDKTQPKAPAPKPDVTVSSSAEKTDVIPVREQQVDLLPSQYPYYPPTLSLQSSLLTNMSTITADSPASVSKEKTPPVPRPNTRASAALLKARLAKTAVSSSPTPPLPDSNTPVLRSSGPPYRVAPVSFLHIANSVHIDPASASAIATRHILKNRRRKAAKKLKIKLMKNSSTQQSPFHRVAPVPPLPIANSTPLNSTTPTTSQDRKRARKKKNRSAKRKLAKIARIAASIGNIKPTGSITYTLDELSKVLNQLPAETLVSSPGIAKPTSTNPFLNLTVVPKKQISNEAKSQSAKSVPLISQAEVSGLIRLSSDIFKPEATEASVLQNPTVATLSENQTSKIVKPGTIRSSAKSPQASNVSNQSKNAVLKDSPKVAVSSIVSTSSSIASAKSQLQNIVLKNSQVAVSVTTGHSTQTLKTVSPVATIAFAQSSLASTKFQKNSDSSAQSPKLTAVTTQSQDSLLKNPSRVSISGASVNSTQKSKIVLSGPDAVSTQLSNGMVKPNNSAQLKLPTIPTQSTTVLKNPPKVTISGGLKASAQVSKTVFKSATTLIKSTRVPNKRPAESSSHDLAKRKALPSAEVAVEKPVHLRLPRHQPVVVNIGDSSDEDDSVVSPTRIQRTAKNPLDYHKNMLEAMIKQARAQTSVKQDTKEDDKTKVLSSTQDANQASVGGQDVERPSKTHSQMNNPSKSVTGKNASAMRQTSIELKLKTRQQKHPTNGQSHKDTVSNLRQTREKFLKLKTLIGKDEVAYLRLIKIKERKSSELKSVNDELKEMMHRVALIKGKAAKCEELIEHYKQHETKINTRLEKRKDLKLKLKDRIKRQMLKARSEQLAKKMKAVINSADARSNQSTSIVSKVTENVVPAKLQSQEKLDQEKQRLLAVEQQLAAEIDKMKKSDVNAAATSRRRVSLSREVQSHLAKYKETKKPNNPTAHDLSLSKIAITANSPVRNQKGFKTVDALSPVRKLLTSPVSSGGSSPVAKKVITAAVVETNENKTIKPVLEEKSSDTASEVERGKLRKIIHRSLTDMKSLFRDCDQPFSDFSRTTMSWHKKTPDFFKQWKVDIGEFMFHSEREDIRERKTYKFQSYESPLRTFHSYRLSPFLRMKEKLTIKSKTFSNKINPEQIFCKYDLTGTCQDPDCRGQHLKQYELTSSELILDLLSYCPELLGENLRTDLEYKDLIKMAESACDKLCGTSSNQINAMSIDEKCILTASKINATLGNKAPFTTVMRPRKINILQEHNKTPWKNYLQQDFDVENDDVVNTDNVISLDPTNKNEHPDSFVKEEERYFIERQGSLHRIEDALKQNPHDIQLWLELAYKKMQKCSDGRQSSLEIGLHTMCLALEENPYVGELWGHYLGLLRRHKGAESEQDRNEMVSQAIELVPLSTRVWNQLLSWDCDIIKREFFYDQLISNLIRNVEGGEILEQLPHDVASRWLLQTVLQKVQLQLFSCSVTDVLSFLETTVKNFSQQCRSVSSTVGNSPRRCLTPTDLSALWLCYINVKFFNALPQCFLPCESGSDLSVKSCLGVVVSPEFEVKLGFNGKNTLDTIFYCDLCADLNVAIKECATSKESECIECVDLFRERLRLEIFQHYWNTAVETCDLLWTKLSETLRVKNCSESVSGTDVKRILTDIAITWADVLVKKGDIAEATKVFENAVIQNPADAHLCYEAALFQLNQESTDVDEVLLYFESCASAYLKIEKDTLTAAELRNIFQFLLRLPLPLTYKSPDYVSEKARESVKKSKAYFWLIYITLLEISGESNNTVMDNYELSIIDIENEKDRRQIWIKYLLYRLSHAPAATESSTNVSKSRQTWLRNFTAVVRRCITTCSSDLRTDDALNIDVRFSDYWFHNEIASIFLSCFHTRHQTSTAYMFLTELMPYNTPLLLRACRHFLSFGDYSTIMSILWRVTSSASCQNETIWKISIAAHFSRGRIAKALHLCRRSVEAMQYSHGLWSNYLALLKAFGKPSDFAAEKDRCTFILQFDATRLLPEGFSQRDKQGV